MQRNRYVAGISQHNILPSSYNTLAAADNCASCCWSVVRDGQYIMLRKSNCVAIALHRN